MDTNEMRGATEEYIAKLRDAGLSEDDITATLPADFLSRYGDALFIFDSILTTLIESRNITDFQLFIDTCRELIRTCVTRYNVETRIIQDKEEEEMWMSISNASGSIGNA
jgi:hypothetical protein